MNDTTTRYVPPAGHGPYVPCIHCGKPVGSHECVGSLLGKLMAVETERDAAQARLSITAEAINDIADVLALPTGSTAKDAVEGVRRLAAERDAALADRGALTEHLRIADGAIAARYAERNAALAQVPKWVFDRTPADCTDVLAVWWQGEQCIAHRRNGTWWYRGNFGMKEANVPPTHWMPLPAVPKL